MIAYGTKQEPSRVRYFIIITPYYFLVCMMNDGSSAGDTGSTLFPTTTSEVETDRFYTTAVTFFY